MERHKGVMRGAAYAMGANAIGLAVSVVTVLIVPKTISVEQYGYFQLYVLYASYVGFLHFGWADGVYLRYGGIDYPSLDRGAVSGQFWVYTAVEWLLGGVIVCGSVLLAPGDDRGKVLLLAGLCVGVQLPKTMLVYILQATNRLREYAMTVAIEKVAFVCAVVALLGTGHRSYAHIVASDLAGRAAALGYCVWIMRDIVWHEPQSVSATMGEAWRNISCGVHLMFANIASMLVFGLTRFAISERWSITTFGKVSLSLSVSSLLMTFVASVGIALFPALCRLDREVLGSSYRYSRAALSCVLLGFLAVHAPIKHLLSLWLPDYADSMRYLAVVFPICVYEGRMAMLTSTYLKAVRAETLLTRSNVITLLIAAPAILSSVMLLQSLEVTLMALVVILAMRAMLAERWLETRIQVKMAKDNAIEGLLVAAFMGATWIGRDWVGACIYGIAYAWYLIARRRHLARAVRHLQRSFAGG